MTNLDVIIQQIINALSIGSQYALMAIGLGLIFGILNLINFAHGDMLMIGSYATLFAILVGVPFWYASLIGIAVTIISGLLIERIAYRPIRNATQISTLLTSFAVSVFLENGAQVVFGPNSRAFPVPPILDTVIVIGDITVKSLDIVAIIVSIIIMVLLTIFITRTKIGTQMRAVSQDLLASRLMGINVNRVIVWAFIIASGLACVVGIFWSARAGKVDPLMGFFPSIKAFIAAVIGGLGSIPGAVLGGFILGGLEIFLQGFLPSSLSPYRDAFVFLALIIMLLFRPNGILGTSEKEKI
jgi:branched-chain amino acid transport system permease protein